MSKDNIKVTDNGRLYIETKDFFKNKKVQDIITKLKESSLYKQLNKENNE